jgi:hypothetical protein
MRAIKHALTISGFAGIFVVLVLASALLTAAVYAQLASQVSSRPAPVAAGQS